MASVRLVVDGETWMDGDLGTWQEKSLEEIVEQLVKGQKSQPWMRAALNVLADSAVNDRDTRITIETRPTGWTLTVDQ